LTAAACSGVYSLSAGLWSTGVDLGGRRIIKKQADARDPEVNDEALAPAEADPGLGELFVLLGVEDGSVDEENVDDDALDAGEELASSASTLAMKASASGVGKRAMDLFANFFALE
jgi:hypothetical protein